MKAADRWVVFLSVGLLVSALSALLATAARAPRRRAETVPMAQGVVRPGDLQAAIDAAQPGDTLTLQAGATYVGPFFLRQKTGDAWIVIRSNLAGLLGKGQRVEPGQASLLPKLVSASGSVISADSGAHHYRLEGLEIAPTPGSFLLDVVLFGSTETTLDAVAHDLAIEQCYIHGDPAKGSRRGVALNSASTTIADSYFSDFKEVGNDSQAIAGWNGPGPFQITNNYLEGAGENILFGGADPTIPNLVPSNIQIQGNYVSKPVRWRDASVAAQQGGPWSVKNLLELKNAANVTISGNTFENVWSQAQTGIAILFTPRNQNGSAPWSTVRDVTFSNNLIRHVGGGVNILGQDDINISQPLARVTIQNNAFEDVGPPWGVGRLFQLLNGTTAVTISHNTGFQADAMVWAGDTTPHTGFVFEDNIAMQNQYGIIGSGTAPGLPSIAQYLPGATIRGNVIIGGNSSWYPSANFFAQSMSAVGFVAPPPGSLQLSRNSPFSHKATDGTDPGVDVRGLPASLYESNGTKPVQSRNGPWRSLPFAVGVGLVAWCGRRLVGR